MKHTPGPWTIERGHNDFDILVGNARLCGYIQREADADLIAAAPDLLIALRGLKAEVNAALGMAEEALREAYGRTNLSVLKHWRDRAEAAIAKAGCRPPSLQDDDCREAQDNTPSLGPFIT